MSDTGWNLADLWEAMAAQIPDELAQQQGDRRLHVGRVRSARQRRAAALLAADGAAEQDKVAQYLYNSPEYLESVFAAFKAGMAVVNTNYRYAADELVYLWDNADVTTVVFHGSFTEQCAAVRDRVPRVTNWLWVDDGSGACPDWATSYEAAANRGHGRTRRRPVGPIRRPSPAALHRWHDRHAQGRDVAPRRPVRCARCQQQEANATRTGPRCRHRTRRHRGTAQHARRAADARHGAVQRDQQPDGRWVDHDDGGPVVQRRRVPRQRRALRHQLDVDRRRRIRQADPPRARRRARPLGHHLAARHRVVGGHVVEGDEGRPAPAQPPPDHGRRPRLVRGDRHGDQHHDEGIGRRDRTLRTRTRTPASSPTKGATSRPGPTNSAASPSAVARRSATTRTRRSRPRPS